MRPGRPLGNRPSRRGARRLPRTRGCRPGRSGRAAPPAPGRPKDDKTTRPSRTSMESSACLRRRGVGDGDPPHQDESRPRTSFVERFIGVFSVTIGDGNRPEWPPLPISSRLRPRSGDSSPISTTPPDFLVPTLRVGMPSSTLRVVRSRGPSGRGRRASRTAFPRGAWERGERLTRPEDKANRGGDRRGVSRFSDIPRRPKGTTDPSRQGQAVVDAMRGTPRR